MTDLAALPDPFRCICGQNLMEWHHERDQAAEHVREFYAARDANREPVYSPTRRARGPETTEYDESMSYDDEGYDE